MKPRLIAVHLLNDRSGSPLVLRQALAALRDEYEVQLFTATPSGDGFLNDIAGVRQQDLFYRWSPNKAVTLFYFLLSQVLLFLRLAFVLRKADTVYVNTLLPFGAALAGRLRGCRVVYHIHEVSLKPAVLKNFLTGIAGRTADRVLSVSEYVAAAYSFSRPRTAVVYNALEGAFAAAGASMARPEEQEPFTVLMLCSPKAYKGIYHFISVAKALPGLRFMLVLNGSGETVSQLIDETKPSQNCTLYPATTDTLSFYRQAHVVLNLSRPDGWIETFGMTVLEAMQCGRPVIVPPVGGVCELVTDSLEGFRADSRDEAEIVRLLTLLSTDAGTYNRMAVAARRKAAQFSPAAFRQAIRQQLYPIAGAGVSPYNPKAATPIAAPLPIR